MSDNVHTLAFGASRASLVTPEPDAQLVERIEQLLVLAKSGEMRSVALAWTDAAGAMTTGWSLNVSPHSNLLGGAIAQLLYRYNKHIDERD